MTTTAQLEFFREVFTKKTCIYLPNSNGSVEENCIVLESEYIFRKKISNNRGEFALDTVAIGEDVNVKKTFNNNKNCLKEPRYSSVKEKLYPVIRKNNSATDSNRDILIKSFQLSKRNSNRTESTKSQKKKENVIKAHKKSLRNVVRAKGVKMKGNKIVDQNTAKNDSVTAKSSPNKRLRKVVNITSDRSSSKTLDSKTLNTTAVRNEDVGVVNSNQNKDSKNTVLNKMDVSNGNKKRPDSSAALKTSDKTNAYINEARTKDSKANANISAAQTKDIKSDAELNASQAKDSRVNTNIGAAQTKDSKTNANSNVAQTKDSNANANSKVAKNEYSKTNAKINVAQTDSDGITNKNENSKELQINGSADGKGKETNIALNKIAAGDDLDMAKNLHASGNLI